MTIDIQSAEYQQIVNRLAGNTTPLRSHLVHSRQTGKSFASEIMALGQPRLNIYPDEYPKVWYDELTEITPEQMEKVMSHISTTSRNSRTSQAKSAHAGRVASGSGSPGASGGGGNSNRSSKSADSTGGHQLPRLGKLSTSQNVKTRGS